MEHRFYVPPTNPTFPHIVDYLCQLDRCLIQVANGDEILDELLRILWAQLQMTITSTMREGGRGGGREGRRSQYTSLPT